MAFFLACSDFLFFFLVNIPLTYYTIFHSLSKSLYVFKKKAKLYKQANILFLVWKAKKKKKNSDSHKKKKEHEKRAKNKMFKVFLE